MDPKKTPLKKSKMARRHGRLRTVDAPPCPPVPVVPKRPYLRAISDFFVGVFLGSMYVLSRSWLATKARYLVNLGVHSHRPPPGDVAAAPPLSPSRRPRPRHDPPATFACPVGLWRRLRVRSDTGLATRPRRASAAGLAPLLWRHTGKSRCAFTRLAPDCSWSRTGPIMLAVLDANVWGRVPFYTPVLG